MSFFSYDMLKNLKPGEFAVYNFIISHMEKIPSMNIRELAEITGVSTTTVLRFCEKAGCEGYTEFKYRIKCRMSEPEGRNNYDSAPALQFIKNVERDELFQDKLGEVADLIAQSGQVIFPGMVKEGHLHSMVYICLTLWEKQRFDVRKRMERSVPKKR